LDGRGSIVYIDDIYKLSNSLGIDVVENYEIYIDDFNKLNILNDILFKNCRYYISDIYEVLKIPHNIVGRVSILLFNDGVVNDIKSFSYYKRLKQLKKLQKKVYTRNIEKIFTPKKTIIMNKDVVYEDISLQKLFEPDIIIDQPIIEIVDKSVKVIDSFKFKIEVVNDR